MPSTSIKLKATVKDGMVEVKALIAHPMESGQRKDEETGKLIAHAHFGCPKGEPPRSRRVRLRDGRRGCVHPRMRFVQTRVNCADDQSGAIRWCTGHDRELRRCIWPRGCPVGERS